ncbi:MAG: DUF4258 domain-containing protein [Terriglobia bacterium]
MKTIRLTAHALEQCTERGASEAEVREAIDRGVREPAKQGRFMWRLNLQYGAPWQDRFYAIKQVAPVVVEEQSEIVVVTVYTFYF